MHPRARANLRCAHVSKSREFRAGKRTIKILELAVLDLSLSLTRKNRSLPLLIFPISMKPFYSLSRHHYLEIRVINSWQVLQVLYCQNIPLCYTIHFRTRLIIMKSHNFVGYLVIHLKPQRSFFMHWLRFYDDARLFENITSAKAMTLNFSREDIPSGTAHIQTASYVHLRTILQEEVFESDIGDSPWGVFAGSLRGFWRNSCEKHLIDRDSALHIRNASTDTFFYSLYKRFGNKVEIEKIYSSRYLSTLIF